MAGLVSGTPLEKPKTPEQEKLEQFSAWRQESLNMRSTYETRWAKNIRLMKGIWSEEELTRSKVRNRSKIFFRKIWAVGWRLLASFYQAFLKDEDNSFEVNGRGPEDVAEKEKILQFMAQYHMDVMDNEKSLFLHHIWGMQNMISMGVAVAKFCWHYDDDYDGPQFTTYPNEQVFLDFMADTKNKMRFIMFENYMTMPEMKRMKYDNLGDAVASSIPVSPVRSARFFNHRDPVQAAQEKHYPSPENNKADVKESKGPIYIVQEWFWRGDDGKIQMATVNETHAILKKPEESPYGKCYPAVVGVCLTESNKLIGEGFAEPLEGPQESYNHLINVRKDNVHLVLNKHSIVSRFGNVDLASLVNSRAGGVTLADDVNAVKDREMHDVTQSAYVEAGQDDNMMEEMSGVVDAKSGTMKNEKATTAQINLTEANAKIELFIAIVASTWFKDFYRTLIYMIQRFETDEKVFQVANQKLQRKHGKSMGLNPYTIYEVDDFDADVRVKVGLSATAKQNKIQQVMTAMDRAIMANQSAIALLKSGAVPPNQKLRMFDTTKFMEDILPDLGIRNPLDYFMEVQAPAQQEAAPAAGTQNDAAQAGAVEPQMSLVS